MRACGRQTTNISNLDLNRCLGLEIPLPPLAEQRRIASILDQAEALRAKRRHTLVQLDALTQSLFLDLFGDLQTNSRYWPVKKLGELCEAAIDCPHSTPVYATRPTLHPCVRSSDIQGATLDFTATKYVEPEEYQKRIARGRPRAGDVIYCREGARFGNAARVTDNTQLCLGQRMMLLRPRVDRATTEFLWAFLSSRAAYRQATRALDGSASPHVNIRDIVAFRVPVPPLPLQREFAAQVSAVERLKTSQQASLMKLDTLFASLQHRAFRGEL